jgi:YVTN family beta-propeller protein
MRNVMNSNRCSRQHRPPHRISTRILVPLLLLAAAGLAEAQPKAYVASGSAGVVTAIDTATNTPVATIPVGVSPTRVAVSADGTHAYVTNSASSSVSVIDTATDAVVATIDLGGNPSALAVTPDGASLYVLLTSGVVEVVDTLTQATSATVTIGATGGGGIALTPDGTRAYVAAGLVSVVDTVTNTVVRTFPAEVTAAPDVTTTAIGVAVAPDGARAYVTTTTFFFGNSGFSGGGSIAVVDTATDTVTQAIWLGAVPGPIALTPDGSRAYVAIDNIWVNTGYGAGFLPGRSVAVVDTLTSTVAGSIDLGAAGTNWTLQNTAKGVVVTPDRGHVYASVPRLGIVAVADVNTNLVVSTIPVAAGPSGLGAAAGGSPLVPYLVDAVADAGTVSTAGGIAGASVLTNDGLGGLRPTPAHVTLSKQSSTGARVTLDAATGAVGVAPGTAVGTYTLVYRMCVIAAPTNCDDATVTVTVRAPFVINAVDDSATSFPARTAVPNVLVNDTLAGAAATLALVNLTQVSSTSTGVTLDTATGSVVVAAGASLGTQTLVYRICERASPANCDDARVTLTIVAYLIDAVDDIASAPRTGGTVIANVLANDRLAGAVATVASVTLSLEGAAPSGVTLNAATGAVVVAAGAPVGTHTLRYRICERARPSNCDAASVSVTVNPYVVSAVHDYARGSSKAANTALASVLTNDRFAGTPATIAKVRLSLVSLTPANEKIRLDLTDGSVDVLGKTNSGLYALVYQICEAASPTNCARATVTVDLSGK